MTRSPRDASPTAGGPLGPVLGLGILLLLALIASAGLQGYRDLAATRQREALLRTRVAEIESRIRGLEERISRLRDDPLTLERLAREELGLVLPDDAVIVLPAAEPSAVGADP